MHRMYKVCTADGIYAVKHLNPDIMKRPDAAENYARAERLESIIEHTDIPIVPALAFEGRKMLSIDGEYFYIFRWHDGNITDWYDISSDQCFAAGNILGSIHSIEQRNEKTGYSCTSIDWDEYTDEAMQKDKAVGLMLADNISLLRYATDEVNKARVLLPDIICISDEDMDPKNVIWDKGRPYVIDLECLDYGNPVSHALQLSLQWSGVTTCCIDTEHIKAFFDGYRKVYDNGFTGYDKVTGLAYTWVEWLEYNIRRALAPLDEQDRLTGVSQTEKTIDRIRYIRRNEADIRSVLAEI